MSQTKAQLLDGKSATIQFTGGSASAPSVSFTGDENTGIYSPGADQVAISTGGSGRLFVDASGNVGVSTSSPGTRLHVNDGFIRTSRYGAAGVVQLDRAQGTAASPTAISSSAGIGAIQARGFDGSNYQVGGALFFITDGAVSSTSSPAAFTVETTSSGSTTSQERLRITSAGRIGVGTSNPQSPLHSYAGTNTRNNIYVQGTEYGIRLGNKATVGASIDGVDATNGVTSYQPLFLNGSTVILGTDDSERLRITSAGLVGVGTSTPGSQLDIVAQDNIRGTGFQPFWTLRDSNDSNKGIRLQSAGGAGLFYTDSVGNGTWVERVRVTAGGNVGIGTTSPAYKLHVVDSVNEGVILQVLNNYSGAGTGNNAIVSCANTNNYFNMQLLGQQNFALLATNSQYTLYRSPLHIFQNSAGTTEYGRFDGSGRLLVGTSSARSVAGNFGGTTNQILFETVDVASFSAVGNKNDSSGPIIALGKSRSGSIGGVTAVQAEDILGAIKFAGANGTDLSNIGAEISAVVDGTPFSSGDTTDLPGRLVFSTTADGASSPTERMRIDSDGYTKLTNDGSAFDLNGLYHEVKQSLNSLTLLAGATNGSFTDAVYGTNVHRAATSTYSFFYAYSGNFGDLEFRLYGDGNGKCDGAWTGGGADYAEYFEWADSNPDAEDRRGISVVLDGDKIREAQAGDDPIGVISGNPSVVGDAAWNKWSGKYLRDEFGTYIQEDYEVTDDDGNTVIQQRRKLNPAYDPDVEYVSREQRPEWDCVGLMGKLRIRKGQVTGSRWIKMRDVSDSVEEWLVR